MSNRPSPLHSIRAPHTTAKQPAFRLVLLTATGCLLLAAPSARTQTPGTNALPLNQTIKFQQAVEHDRSLGERALLPPGLKEKLKLTVAQRAELKPIEDDFANTCQKYQLANQVHIDAAQEAKRVARVIKNTEQIGLARRQMQEAWAGLLPSRVAAVLLAKPILTPDQLTILEDPKNQWNENHADEANDPSAN